MCLDKITLAVTFLVRDLFHLYSSPFSVPLLKSVRACTWASHNSRITREIENYNFHALETKFESGVCDCALQARKVSRDRYAKHLLADR